MDRLYVKVGKKLVPFAWGCMKCKTTKVDDGFKLEVKRQATVFYRSRLKGDYCYGTKRTVYRRDCQKWIRVGYLYYPEGYIELSSQSTQIKMLNEMPLDQFVPRRAWKPLQKREIVAAAFTCECGKRYAVNFDKRKIYALIENETTRILMEVPLHIFLVKTRCPLCANYIEVNTEDLQTFFICRRCESLFGLDLEAMEMMVMANPKSRELYTNFAADLPRE